MVENLFKKIKYFIKICQMLHSNQSRFHMTSSITFSLIAFLRVKLCLRVRKFSFIIHNPTSLPDGYYRPPVLYAIYHDPVLVSPIDDPKI